MEETKGVTSESPTEKVTEDSKTPVEVEKSETQPIKSFPPKGYVPYESVLEERRKNQILEEELRKAKESQPSENGELYSDEGKLLKSDIKALKDELQSLQRKDARREVEIIYPLLKEKKSDFDAFLEEDDNRRLSLPRAAKLFLTEQGLLEPVRKGLEKTISGGQLPPKAELTKEEVKDMMQNDWKRYEKLLRQGKIV